MPTIQVFAGHADGEDKRPPSVKNHGYIPESNVTETLRQIGLEYRTADYFGNRQVIIVINPDPELPMQAGEVERLKQVLRDQGFTDALIERLMKGFE